MSSSTRNLTGAVVLTGAAVALVLLASCKQVDGYEPAPPEPATAPQPPVVSSLIDPALQVSPGGLLPLGDITGGVR